MMVKTSNNEHYRVSPVYGFVEKSSKTNLQIIRLEGPPKADKFVVQWAEKIPVYYMSDFTHTRTLQEREIFMSRWLESKS
uniref:MSP domain-containing protein n=1 Tax=Parascaris equorum TaxID=6256 RepID=A0A914RYQ9_PAREQ